MPDVVGQQPNSVIPATQNFAKVRGVKQTLNLRIVTCDQHREKLLGIKKAKKSSLGKGN